VADIPVDNLAEDAPIFYKDSKVPAYYEEFQSMPDYQPEVTNHAETLAKLLQQPTIASKEYVYDQYDSMVQGNTVFSPGSDAAVVRIRDYNKSIAMTIDCNSRYIYLDPETGGKIAVAEAARNIVATGAKPLAITDGLNFGNPDKPENFWQMEKSIDGISEACLALDTPVISGNVSLYNETNDESIYPTPIIGMVGLHESLDHITPSHFQEDGDLIYIIGETKGEFGGSELQNVLEGKYFGKAPSIDLEVEVARQQQLLEAIQSGLIQSAHDISEGGMAVAVVESLFGKQKLGASIEVTGDITSALFSESQSRFIVSIKEQNKTAFEVICKDAMPLGKVTNTENIQISQEGKTILEESVRELEQLWKGAIPCLLK